MTTGLTIPNERAIDLPNALQRAGQAANEVAARHVFDDYRSRKAANTITRQDGDLALFTQYLGEAGVTAGDLAHDPDAWRGVTWGLVEGFVKWQLQQSYSVGSVNVRLSTVKTYTKLALKAGTLDPTEYALIRAVSGYSHKEGKRINDARREAGTPTRRGYKKAEAKSLTKEQAEALKSQPNDPQGRRDALIMCLMLDHGLRVSEVAALTVADVDLKAGTLTFWREKVDTTQTHKLTADTLSVAKTYLDKDALAIGPLVRSSQKGGRLRNAGMSKRAMTARVRTLGERIGIDGLSAHDLRHYWATQAARNSTPLDALMDAGGWKSPSTALGYVEAAKIANERVRLE